jgi:hypothetical protein
MATNLKCSERNVMATADSDKYCKCEHPIPVVTSPIDTVDTCKKCGKTIKGSFVGLDEK